MTESHNIVTASPRGSSEPARRVVICHSRDDDPNGPTRDCGGGGCPQDKPDNLQSDPDAGDVW